MYLYIFTCMHVYIYVHTCIYVYAYTHICTHTYIYIFWYIFIYEFIYMYVYIHTEEFFWSLFLSLSLSLPLSQSFSLFISAYAYIYMYIFICVPARGKRAHTFGCQFIVFRPGLSVAKMQLRQTCGCCKQLSDSWTKWRYATHSHKLGQGSAAPIPVRDLQMLAVK